MPGLAHGKSIACALALPSCRHAVHDGAQSLLNPCLHRYFSKRLSEDIIGASMPPNCRAAL
jgi:hypothetical protein